MFCGSAFGWHAEAGIHVLRLIRFTSAKLPSPQVFTSVLTAELMLVNATAESARIHARAVKSGYRGNARRGMQHICRLR